VVGVDADVGVVVVEVPVLAALDGEVGVLPPQDHHRAAAIRTHRHATA
jgi:hypothetical protein